MTEKTKRGPEGRVFKRGDRWWIAFYLRGCEYRLPAKEANRENNPEKAQAKAVQLLKQKIREKNADEIGARQFTTPAMSRVSVAELLDSVERDLVQRGKLSVGTKSLIGIVRARFGDLRANAVSSETISKFITEALAAGYKPASVNRRIEILHQAFVLAIRQKQITEMPYFPALSEIGNARRGFTTRRELDHVLAGLPADLRDFVLFAFLSSWRKGEISSLQWDSVASDAIRLNAENSKERESRSLALTGELAEVVERRRKLQKGPYVFHRDGQQVAEFRKSWHTACCLAGLGKFVCPQCGADVTSKRECKTCGVTWKPEQLRYVGLLFHDLRRSGVRDMIRSGVSPIVAMSISGHKTDAMLRRYAIISQADQRRALERTQEFRHREMQEQAAKENRLSGLTQVIQ